MSTKIYSGYKLPMKNTFELTEFWEEVRSQLLPIREGLAKKRIATDFINLVDEIFTNDKLTTEGYKKRFEEAPFWLGRDILSLIVDDAARRQRDIFKTMQRDPTYDFSFDVKVVALSDKILLNVITESNELMAAWKNIPELEPYGYWDNVDREEGVSHEEWLQRENDWNKAYGQGEFSRGFVLELFFKDSVRYNFGRNEDLLSLMPDYESRLNRIAKEGAAQKEYSKSGKSISDYIRAERYVRDNSELIEAEKPGIRILEEIREEHLLMNFEQVKSLADSINVK